MNLEQNFKISIIVTDLPTTLQKQAERPRLRQIFLQALAECQKLIYPRGIWSFFPVKTITKDQYIVQNAVAFTPGQYLENFSQSVGIVVGLCTLGKEFDQKMAEYQKTNMTLAVILDSLGSWVVQQIRNQLSTRIQKILSEEGLQASNPFRPGEGSWPMTDQAKVFQFLDGKAIGLNLNESMLMVPLKSSSFILNVQKSH